MLRRSGASSYSRDHIKFIFCPSAWKREIDEVLSMVYRDGEDGRCILSCSAAVRSSNVDRFITLNRICAKCIYIYIYIYISMTFNLTADFFLIWKKIYAIHMNFIWLKLCTISYVMKSYNGKSRLIQAKCKLLKHFPMIRILSYTLRKQFK